MEKQHMRRPFVKRVLFVSVSCMVAFVAMNTVTVSAQDVETKVETQMTNTPVNHEGSVPEKKAVTETGLDENSAIMPVNEDVTDKETRPNETTSENTTKDSVNAEVGQAVTAEKQSAVNITLPQSTVYMTDATTIEEMLPSGTKITQPLTWTYDGKPIETVKTWNLTPGAGGGFTGSQFITVTEKSSDKGTAYQIQVNSLFGSDLSERTRYGNIRREYRKHIGEHILKGTSQDGSVVLTKVIRLRPYESFHTHEEMLADIEESKNQALSNRQVKIETIGKSAQGRDIKMGIISKDQQAIDDYLNKTTPMMLTKPEELLKLLESDKLDYKLPILFNNTHADEQPGIDIVRGLFKDFATKEKITFTTTENNQVKQVEIDVSKILERFILLFNFTENPDGDVNNSRQLANGMDPNRDASYQTNPETRAIVEQMNKWNPISVLDFHGFVKGFLIEPATPPHDPNFEYDLISNHLLEEAHQMGRAGVANSKYQRYVIPKLDYGSGWDDSFSGYTAVYALYHGILGHTVEIPESNQESYKAGFFAGLAGVNYAMNNHKQLMKMRLAFYARGINKVESPEAEKELVGPDGEVVGRLKGNNPKFFPDYYVLPMSVAKENPTDQAFNMIEYFKRNGVIVKELKEDFAGYKKGDLVIDMAQAKRGFANHILYGGSDESKWQAMYAELLVNFPIMRGFKAFPIFNHSLFTDKLGDVTHQSAPRTQITEDAPYYVVANNSVATIRAINDALKTGAKIYRTKDGYIMSKETFAQALQKHALYGEPLYKQPVGEPLKRLKIYSPYHTYNWTGDLKMWSDAQNALAQVGFDIVQSYDEADVLVLDGNEFDASWLGKKPTIIVGGVAMQRLEELGVLPGFDAEQFEDGSDFEGLMKAIVDKTHPLSSGYAENDLIYSNSGNWIEKAPAGFKPIVKIAGKDFYLAGWWPKHDVLANKIMALDGTYNNQPMFIYAGNPMNKMHPLNFYRWIANAIYRGSYAELVDIPKDKQPIQPQPDTPKPPKSNQTDDVTKTGTDKTNTPPVAAAKQLPNTGTQQDNHFMVSTMFVTAGAFILKLNRKKEN